LGDRSGQYISLPGDRPGQTHPPVGHLADVAVGVVQKSLLNKLEQRRAPDIGKSDLNDERT
jgi:hypothetical protein